MQQPKEQSIRKKIGSILGLGASRATPTPQKDLEELGKLEHSTFFTADVLRELGSNMPTQRRVRAMKEHNELVATRRLEEHAVESIWNAIKDLIEPSQPVDIRHDTLTFIRNLIYGQFEDLGVLRAHFLNVIQKHNVREDVQLRLTILRVLTQDGKNIHHLEESIGPFLLSWMPEVVDMGHSTEFLNLLINFVHYNAAFLDGEVVIGLVRMTCALARQSPDSNVLTLCLDFVSAVVCYSTLPAQSLHDLVITLCHTLNVEKFAKRSLEVMLKLLGTHLGRSTIYTMCTIMQQERSGDQNACLLRGAVFYVSMSMWGIRKVQSLDLTFASVLPSIKLAVLSNHTIVVYEVALSLVRLVRTYSSSLHLLEWDIIYDIMAAIQDHLKLLRKRTGETSLLPSNSLGECLRKLFASIEELYNAGTGISIGEPEKFFDLVEENMETMPLKSVLTLVSYRMSTINGNEYGYVEKVVSFMEKFYVLERRSPIRIEMLKYLGRIMEEKSICYEQKLMELVVLKFLQDVANDPDMDVRCHATKLLVQLLSLSSLEWGTQILALINSILRKGLQVASKAKEDKLQSSEGLPLNDSKAAVYGLIEAFKEKLQSSSPVAAQILSVLVVLLQQHYDEGHFFPTAYWIRKKIFECILNLRSNEFGQVGYLKDGSIQFSPFFVCHQSGGSGDHTPVITPMLLDYRTTFSAVLACLEKECDFDVLVQVLRQLNTLLQDRALTLSSLPDLSNLCQLLCDLVDEKSPRVQKLRSVSTSHHSSRVDLSSIAFPVLTTLVTYPSHLDRTAQFALVCCLENGLVSKSAQMCVSSLSLCSLELQATMKHLLPHVLQRMGQVAATPTLALPVLEFLSGLIPIPSLYNGFSDREYLSVFAIALPYTDHQKYTLYELAMAHRVIAQWFVRCRMHYRPIVANFICKKLSINLGGSGLNRPIGSQASSVPPSVAQRKSEDCTGVGAELAEVCMDLMARYTYSNLSTLPSRSTGSDFLVAGGPSKSWLVGNSLITITTSKPAGSTNGVCKRCASNKTREETASVVSLNISDASSADASTLGGGNVPSLCSCFCGRWAEIKIRRPSGNIGWMMQLQNRPYPLSLTHPSTHGIPESELGLLAANVPSERISISERPSCEGTVRETQIEEEIFFSREVGSFTDISFMSNIPSSIASAEHVSAQDNPLDSSNVEIKIVSGGEEPAKVIDPGEFRINDDSCIATESKISDREIDNGLSNALSDSMTEVSKVCEGGASEVVKGDEDEAGLLNISDTDTIMQDSKDGHSESEKDDRKLESGKSASVPPPDSSCQASGPLPPIKRSSNSRSWSEDGVTSPLPIAPRSSSYSFSMDNLPPLLSYDEGEDFSRSPSLHIGGKIMSEEEQLTLYASMNDIQVEGSDSSTETGSSGTDSEESLEGGESEASNEEEQEVEAKKKEEEGMEVKKKEEEGIEVKNKEEEGDELEEPVPLMQQNSRPRLKQKSASMPTPEGEYTPTHSSQTSLIPPTGSGSKPHPSPLPLRRQSGPPITPPPVNSPSLNRKRLVFSNRPLSASGGGGGEATGPEDQFNNPSFIFLQLYHNQSLGSHSDPITPLPSNETTDRAIKVLDHIPPYETHKVGVVYVDKGQTTERQILSNTFGSSRYLDFLRGLGPLIRLPDIPPDIVYLGGLDRSGTDGEFAYCYHDDITQVIYHVATLMPTDLAADPSCSNKKLHIGNDFVTIVYNDSGTEYKFGTIKGQFNYVEVLIEPQREGMNRVQVNVKKGMEDMMLTSPIFISDTWLPILVRQKALQANLVSRAHASDLGVGGALDCNLSNWLGRLHQINKMKEKHHRDDATQPTNKTPRNSLPDASIFLSDFTSYT